MDKITHKVRCEQWTAIVNECLASGMPKPHVYKRLSTDSRFQWPRSEDELKEITPQQFKWLMEGLSIAPKKKIKELTAPPRYLL